MKWLIAGLFLLMSSGVFGQASVSWDLLKEGPPGVEEVTVIKNMVFEFPEKRVLTTREKFFYDRRGHFLGSVQIVGANHKISDARSYEYDYNENGALKECRGFLLGNRLDFKIEFIYCGDKLDSYRRIEYNEAGDVIDYEELGEEWKCDDDGRVVHGEIRWRSLVREVTCRYGERTLESRGQYGDGKLTEVLYEKMDFLERTRRFYGGHSLSYGKDNHLEEIRYYNESSVFMIEYFNRQGDVAERRMYDHSGSLSDRVKFTYKYEFKNGVELKVEQVKETFADYEVAGDEAEPIAVATETYEYKFHK